MPYELMLAFRYLRSKRSWFITSLVNVMSVLGVFLGVTAMIIVLALMTGFHDELRARILGANSHLIMFSSQSGELRDPEAALETVRQIPDILGAAPFIYRKVMVVRSGRADGIVLKGIDPDQSDQVVDVSSHIVSGDLDDLRYAGATDRDDDETIPGIVLGGDLATSLNANVGDEVRLVSPFEVLTPTGYVPKTQTHRVVGIFQSGMFEYDSSWAYVDLRAAQEFFDMGDGVMGIEMKVRDIFDVDRIATEVTNRVDGVYTRTWIQMNGDLFSALNLEKMVTFLFIILIAVIASFGMTASLTLMVQEKRKEIGILKTMGASNRSLMLVFLLEGLVIGAIGTIAGAVVGFTVCYILDTYQVIQLPGDVYFITHVPFKMKPLDFVLVCSASMLISLQATFFPAWSAANTDPVQVLKGE